MSIPIHPVYSAYLKAIKSGPEIISLTPQQLRGFFHDNVREVLLPEVILEELKVVAGPNKAELTLTVVRPPGTEHTSLPLIFYIHGGGWIFGNKEMFAKPIRDLAVQAHAAVAFLEYSLSPEVKFPVALEECYDTLGWIFENHERINVNPHKVAVVGDSNGGTMTAAVSLMAKESPFSNTIKAQVILYPSMAKSREQFESYHICGTGDYILSKAEIDWFLSHAFAGPLAELDNKLAMPLMASVDDLKDLPPALVLTAEADSLRDEGEAYARKLTDAGVDTVAVRVLGAIHGFVFDNFEAPQYDFAMRTIAVHLATVFKQ
ncbi:hypothetical protein DFQ28_009462 [Apophysomyces sp. BC1034]|nr:hypothetical protein DFQ30_010943 [Apophysomyces sp. BC1015]KAG0172993.1 hypothetical protein DFQ29_008142 [Apophysomyces sp. BC1021]KAG0185378.1 hypothetical protein DFQ28_009462 [Apophysomyces sp. BC1034]